MTQIVIEDIVQGVELEVDLMREHKRVWFSSDKLYPIIQEIAPNSLVLQINKDGDCYIAGNSRVYHVLTHSKRHNSSINGDLSFLLIEDAMDKRPLLLSMYIKDGEKFDRCVQRTFVLAEDPIVRDIYSRLPGEIFNGDH